MIPPAVASLKVLLSMASSGPPMPCELVAAFNDRNSLFATTAKPVTKFELCRIRDVVIRRFREVALMYDDTGHKRDGRWLSMAIHVTPHELLK